MVSFVKKKQKNIQAGNTRSKELVWKEGGRREERKRKGERKERRKRREKNKRVGEWASDRVSE